MLILCVVGRARLSGRFWSFLLELLKKTDRAVAARCLRKHGFLQLVGMTMGECQKKDWAKGKLWRDGRDRDGDVEMEEGSSATELGSSPEGDVLQRQQSRSGETVESICGFLGDVASVVEYLQESTSGATGFGGSAVSVLRGPPELGGQILGVYLDNIHRGLGDLNEEGELNRATRGIEAMIGIWKGCVYGSADLKKVTWHDSIGPQLILIKFWERLLQFFRKHVYFQHAKFFPAKLRGVPISYCWRSRSQIIYSRLLFSPGPTRRFQEQNRRLGPRSHLQRK